MPVNAGIEFIKAEQKYQNAKTREEKLEGLLEMLRTVPKHKGTENLRKEITTKIAKTKKEIEKSQTITAKKGSGKTLNVKKEGAAQISIIGLPNSGKSTFLKKLTGIDIKIASYPFTTKNPEIGMMNYKGALIQLVEMPAIIEGSSQGKANGTQILSAIRNTDAIIVLAQTEQEKKIISNELDKSGIKINKEKPKILIKTGNAKGINLSGLNFLKTTPEKIIETLKAIGIHNASLLFQEPTTIEKLTEALNNKIVYKKALFLNPFKENNKQELIKKIFELSGKIIVFTRKPGQEPDFNEPLVMDKGTTVQECAQKLHKEIAKNIKTVKVWGSTKYSGQLVSKNYKLENEDIIEINA